MPTQLRQPIPKADEIWPKWASNFWYHKPGETVEHLFQAEKTLEPDYKQRILSADSPTIAKRWGREVPLRPDWEEVKLNVMLECLHKKFDIPEYRALLMQHHGTLAEMNTWHDNYWGVCTCVWCGKKGLNMLGQLLMYLRMEQMLNNRTRTT